MNFKLALLFLLGIMFSASAQNGSANGKVVDKNQNLAVPYVTVTVKVLEKVVTGGITDEKGLFDIKNIPFGTYTLELQFMGYKTINRPLTIGATSANVSLGTFKLEDDSVQLEGVTVVAEYSTTEQKIDRKVINVGRDLTTAGATASEIMSNIPSVNVDQDGKISLRGNENVRILVDGRPTTIEASQLLKQIPSTSIKSIELITNPSAKYNPEGMSGIINVILHKNSNNGFNASVNAGITLADEPKFSNSINMNYRTGKVNFFSTLGSNFGKRLNEGRTNRLDENSLQLFDIINDNKSQLVKVGMDYYINDLNTISVYTNQNFGTGDGNFDVALTYPDALRNLNQTSIYKAETQDASYNLAFKHLTKREGEVLDFEMNYNKSTSDSDSFYNTIYANLAIDNSGYTEDKADDNKSFTANLDYQRPLNDKTKLELGAEARVLRTDNEYRSTTTSIADANYLYDLNIYSAYATFGQRFKKISYQLGARVEMYDVESTLNGETAHKNDYITLYPSASMTYALSEKDQFQLSYSRRVDRPSINQTKPIREFSTPKVTSIGNPLLDPQFTNSIEVNYTRTLKKGTLTAGVFVRDINDEINRIIYPDPENVDMQIMTYDNFADNTAYGFEISANYKITKWWDVQPAIDFSSISQRGLVSILNPNSSEFEFVERNVDVSAFNARLNSNFKASKNLRFLLFGFYRGAVDGIQFNSKEMYKIDSGVSYSFLDNKASISVRFNDMFDTMKYAFESDNPYPQSGQFKWESRTVYIGMNYRFGSGKNKSLERKRRENNVKENQGGMF